MDNTMDDFHKFFEETYPRNWHLACDAGVKARDEGRPRVCDLQGSPFVKPSGNILKVYKSAWEQGWDKKDMEINERST